MGNEPTKREREVLGYAARGFSAEQTAAKIGISKRTVETLIRLARLKLKARSVTHAVVLAIRLKILKV